MHKLHACIFADAVTELNLEMAHRILWCSSFAQRVKLAHCGRPCSSDIECSFAGDFKKAFDRVWHAALWATTKKYNISTNLIQVIKNLYNKATSAVLFNGSIGDWFQTTIRVQQGCLLSPTLFNIFLERIMTDALEDDEGTVSIGGRTITNLHFADNIDGLAGEEEELANLVERLNKASTAYGMEISVRRLS